MPLGVFFVLGMFIALNLGLAACAWRDKEYHWLRHFLLCAHVWAAALTVVIAVKGII